MEQLLCFTKISRQLNKIQTIKNRNKKRNRKHKPRLGRGLPGPSPPPHQPSPPNTPFPYLSVHRGRSCHPSRGWPCRGRHRRLADEDKAPTPPPTLADPSSPPL